jgi:undecaprenyl phosphate-alpha-L-ara4N flippase subunit ArnE
LGFVIYAAASVVWFRVVATEPLSVAYPILVSLTFGLVTTGAVLFFGEPLSLRKVIGLLTILGGIVIISAGASR